MRINRLTMPLILFVLFVGGLPAGPAYSKTVTLKVWTWLADPEEGKLYKKWASEYERDHPGIKIKLEAEGWSLDKVLTNYVAGMPPDVYRVGGTLLVQYASKGLLRAIDGPMLRDININDLLKSVVGSGTYKGKLYGWDPHISGSTLSYNTTIFDKAGLSYPNHDFTWEDLALAARKATITQGNRTTQWGYAPFSPLNLLQLMSLCYGHDLWDIKTGEPRFTDAEAVKAAELIKKMAANYKCTSFGIDYINLFKQGKLAMLTDGTWTNPNFVSNSSLKFKVTWTPKGTIRGFLTCPCMWVMSKSSKNPREQWEFYKFWVGKKNSMEFTDFGGPKAYGAPVWKSVLRDPKYKICEFLKEQLDQDDFARPDPFQRFLNSERFDAEANVTLQKAFTDKLDLRQGLDTMNKRSKAIMKYLGQ